MGVSTCSSGAACQCCTKKRIVQGTYTVHDEHICSPTHNDESLHLRVGWYAQHGVHLFYIQQVAIKHEAVE